MANTTGTATKPDPDCCRQTGLIYPDGRKRCAKHATAEDKALTAELNQAARPILGSLHWPYGADVDIAARQRLVTWANKHKLRLAQSRCRQLHWLRTNRCTEDPCNRLGRWMDHLTHWQAYGGPALLLAQPYNIGTQAITQLGEIAATDEFTLQITADHWYGYDTIAVEIWRTDVHTAITSESHFS
ncbi:hypothetical protein [Actinoplanes teichomyceticus]|uniref:Uncharacterized protein n=1 Tax=Actinoplanes teichomyceticus TaxID=1867 RepID=A0A561WC27_ACTTI|nr:hypothetical protein [Actinoplanes teichomyceticus]TWG21421.1 hypothetical protein FHX34_103959 [Actinoplanes teichomyceticus]GIF16604.1 hypothetical protein Ate01nite_66360 [Actinoplanes teichomyceticus]